MKTFFVVLIVLIGAIVAGWYAMPDAEFSVAEIEVKVREEQVEVEELQDGEYVLVPIESSMQWQGNRPLIKGYLDNGVISISKGSATVSSGSVTESEIVINMMSIRAESTSRGRGESLLTRDLKSDNWFDVENYPESLFVLTSYEENEDGTIIMTGELTMKETTDTIRFPARITAYEDRMVVEATDVEVDRTIWDITYQSGSFFTNLGEKLIDDIFTLTFTAVFEVATE